MFIRPVGDKVLLKFPDPERTAGGIVMFDSSDRRMDAVVVAKGGRVSERIQVGQTVVADRMGGIILRIDGVDFRLVPEDVILAENGYGTE